MGAAWDRRPPSEQTRVRDLQFGRWLPQAVAFAPHWTQVARASGFAPDAIDGIEDLQRFAPTDAATLAGAGGTASVGLVMRPTQSELRRLVPLSTLQVVADAIRRDGRDGHRRALLEEYKPIHVQRSGTGARADLTIAYTRSDLDRAHRCGARAAAVLGLRDTDHLLNALPPAPTLRWWGVYHLAPGSSMLALHPRGEGDGLEAAAAAFDAVPVTAVAVTDADAIALAAAAVEARVTLDRVATVVVVGTPPTPARREAITEAWRAAGADAALDVRALWAPGTARALWAECADATAGLHTYPDLEHLELLEGASASADTEAAGGELTITSLGWHGTVLLRARTGVRAAAIDRDACPGCGRTLPRLIGVDAVRQ